MTAKSRRPLQSGAGLLPFDRKTGILHAIVDTPKGSRNKFKFDEERGLFKLAGFFRPARTSLSTSDTSRRHSATTATLSTFFS